MNRETGGSGGGGNSVGIVAIIAIMVLIGFVAWFMLGRSNGPATPAPQGTSEQQPQDESGLDVNVNLPDTVNVNP